MKDKIRTYLTKYYPFDQILSHDPEEPGKEQSFNAYKGSRFLHYFILFLQLLPWLCVLGFIVSFIPSLNPDYTFTLPYFNREISMEGIIKIVSIGGLIGFGTNKLAIRMLFRPVHKRPVWGQGLIPAQKDRIIYALANGMHDHILNPSLIRARLDDSGLVKRINDILIDGTSGLMQDETLREELKKIIYQSLDEYVNQQKVKKEFLNLIDQRVESNVEGVPRFLLRTFKRLNPADYEAVIHKVIENIPKISLDILHKIEDEMNRWVAYIRIQRSVTSDFIMNALTETLEKIDIPSLLRGQMEHFDEVRLEKMVRDATNEQLLYIQYLGALLGMLGGLLIWQPELMTLVYAIVFGILYIIDIIIYRLTQSRIEN